MGLSVNAALEAMYVRDPNLRNVNSLPEAVQAVLGLADIPAPAAPPPVGVQRVDVRQPNGKIVTTWEVFDRRLPKLDRIVKTGLADRASALAEAGKRYIAGGAYTLSAVDSDEYFHDTDYELLGNQHRYGVIEGCAVTADAANMTDDVAAGLVLHNGSLVYVAATTDAWTLVSDSSNERWAALCVSSAGAAVLVSGDAAASSSVEPTKPEIGDRVLLAMAKIQAGQTIAANCEYTLDKRVLTHGGPDTTTLMGFRANRRIVAEYAAQNNTASGTSSAVGAGFYQHVVAATDIVGTLSGEPYMQLGTDASGTTGILSAASGSTNGVAVIAPNTSPRYLARLKLPAASANVTSFVAGFFASAGGVTANGAYLRIATTGNTFFVTRQGGTETTTDLGALSRTTILGFDISTPDAGVTWICRNQAGTILATHTANVPTASTALVYGVHYVWATATIPIGVAYQRVDAAFA